MKSPKEKNDEATRLVAESRAEFRVAHAAGMTALARGDMTAFGGALADEQDAVQKFNQAVELRQDAAVEGT